MRQTSIPSLTARRENCSNDQSLVPGVDGLDLHVNSLQHNKNMKSLDVGQVSDQANRLTPMSCKVSTVIFK